MPSYLREPEASTVLPPHAASLAMELLGERATKIEVIPRDDINPFRDVSTDGSDPYGNDWRYLYHPKDRVVVFRSRGVWWACDGGRSLLIVLRSVKRPDVWLAPNYNQVQNWSPTVRSPADVASAFRARQGYLELTDRGWLRGSAYE